MFILLPASNSRYAVTTNQVSTSYNAVYVSDAQRNEGEKGTILSSVMKGRSMAIKTGSGFVNKRTLRNLFRAISLLVLTTTNAGIVLGSETVSVAAKIEKINLLERTISVSVPDGKKTIELELTRKSKIFSKAVEAGPDSLKVGSNARIKYNSELMAILSIEVDWDLKVLNLEELNSSEKDYSPWISSDGLEIFWAIEGQDKKSTIWYARRKTPETVFGEKKQFYFGHSPVSSSDGLQIYFRNSDSDAISVSNRATRNDDFERPTVVQSLSFPHRNATPSWLSDDGLTLYLDMSTAGVFNKKSAELEESGIEEDSFKAINDKSLRTRTVRSPSGKVIKSAADSTGFRACWAATRESVTSTWRLPTIVEAKFEGMPKDFHFNYATGSPDNLSLFCVSNYGLGVLSRSQASGPFTRWDEILITTPDDQSPYCQKIQYVAATHELFLASNNLFANPSLKPKRWMDLWVVKDFQPPAIVAQK